MNTQIQGGDARRQRWQRWLGDLQTYASLPQPLETEGTLVRVTGLVLEGAGVHVPLGSVCEVHCDGQPPVLAEVVGFNGDRAYLMPTGELHGLVFTDVDGEGTLITTEECLLNPNRNPHLNREQIEQYLADHLAIDSVIWLPDGLFNNETDGHVDNFCCYVRPGEVLLAWTDDASDPNYPRCQAALQVLENSVDAKGRALVVHKMPIPGPLYATQEEYDGVDLVAGSQERHPSVRLAGSYVNFLIVNGGIIAPSFDDPLDGEAQALLQKLFPEHEVVMVPGRELLLGGGNIHCLTQQQPAPVRG